MGFGSSQLELSDVSGGRERSDSGWFVGQLDTRGGGGSKSPDEGRGVAVIKGIKLLRPGIVLHTKKFSQNSYGESHT